MGTQLIIDNGSYTIKAGSSETILPKVEIPSLYGSRVNSMDFDDVLKDESLSLKPYYVGKEVLEHTSLLEISCPNQAGSFRDKIVTERVWEELLLSQQLQNGARDSLKVLLVENSTNKNSDSFNETLEIMFEHLSVGAMQTSLDAACALYSVGLTTGLVIDCGHYTTRAVTIDYGYASAKKSIPIGGQTITKHLMKLISFKQPNAVTSYSMQKGSSHLHGSIDINTDYFFHALKEKKCFVGGDIEFTRKLNTETTYLNELVTLPDGNQVTLNNELYESSEILFQPKYIDLEPQLSMQHLIFEAIASASIDNRAKLASNVILCGGTSLLPGFAHRVEKEVNEIFQTSTKLQTTKIRATNDPDRKYHVYKGAGILAELMKDDASFWINRKEYFEQGVERIVGKYKPT
jgi:POTE ankyrin domain family protein